MSKEERKELVKIGRQLGTLNRADIRFIMDPANSEHDVTRRMITARQRLC